MDIPAHIRLKIPGFASTLRGAVACSAVAMVTPVFVLVDYD
jgi:hypothetical protein